MTNHKIRVTLLALNRVFIKFVDPAWFQILYLQIPFRYWDEAKANLKYKISSTTGSLNLFLVMDPSQNFKELTYPFWKDNNSLFIFFLVDFFIAEGRVRETLWMISFHLDTFSASLTVVVIGRPVRAVTWSLQRQGDGPRSLKSNFI